MNDFSIEQALVSTGYNNAWMERLRYTFDGSGAYCLDAPDQISAGSTVSVNRVEFPSSVARWKK